MKSDLDIFKKHLGEIQGVNEFKANQICSQINDANDFIGALQVLDMSLKKIEKSILERIDENSDDMQKRTLDATASLNKHYKIKVFVKNKQTINLNHPDKNNLNRPIKQ